MGGVECKSQIGAGTCFSRAIAAPVVEVADFESKPLRGMTILVIAAEHDARRFIHEPLRWLGATVEVAQTSESAIARVQNTELASVDAMVIDKREPTDAHIASLRREARTSVMPVIAVGHLLQSKSRSPGVVWIEGNPLRIPRLRMA